MARLVGRRGSGSGPFKAGGLHLVGIGLSADQIRDYYEGFCNATLWPLYHDVIAPPRFHRRWWDPYVAVNRYFAEEADRQAGPGATVWVHDYQLQLVPGCCARCGPTCGSAISTTFPFPVTRSSPSSPGGGRSSRPARLRPGRLPASQRRHQLPARLPPVGGPGHPRFAGPGADAGFDDTHADHAPVARGASASPRTTS